MKNIKSYIAVLLASVSVLTSCSDDWDGPGLTTPVSSLEPNMTIAELKEQYWNNADNYIETIAKDDESHPVISGRVISSDRSGNIYKSLVIQDATGALALSINANSLYVDYRIGQEVRIDLKNMYIGKYSTLQQLGFPDYSAGYGWQATFMPYEFFKEHAQLNGLPDESAVVTHEISLGDLGNSAESLRRYQSQLVRINNVYFEEGGKASFCTAHKENTNRTLKDDNGNSIIVRTSGYANFWSTMIPEGHGDVVGILSTYKSGSSTVWQLLLRSTDDLMNFGNPTLPKGTETNPYDIAEAIEMIAAGTGRNAWYTGYIVGSLKAGVAEVSSNDDILWGADAEVPNTLIIGQTADTKDINQCTLLRLPQDSQLRKYGNLRDVPENYLRQIWILATPGTELGMNALTGNPGTSSTFRIEGVTIPGEEPAEGIPAGDGTDASPYNPTQVVGMGTDANVANKWVKGYIVGWVDNSGGQNFADEKNSIFTVPATVATNILLATTPDVKDYSKCCVVNLPNTNDIRKTLNLVDNPGNLGRPVAVKGTIRKYFNIPGVRDLTEINFEGGSTGGGDEPGGDTPVTGTTTADLNTLEAKSSYGTYTTTAGWVLTNCAVQSGGDVDNNPVFKFIGSADTRAACLNGKKSTPGKITSPTLAGGIKSLTFKYGFAFSDTKCKFTINIIQSGTVKATKTVTIDKITKLEAVDFSWTDINVTGDFVMEIVNDCYSGSTSNKDRVSIWNIAWTN